MTEQQERWGSRVGVILAVAGSAVGMGNFLRFPGQVAQNGGGAFMIPYFCALLFLGIPICWAEWSLGRYGGSKGLHSAPAILGIVGRGSTARYSGVLGLLVPLIVYMYYVLIESWCLRYFVAYLTGSIDLGPDPTRYTAQSGDFFTAVTGDKANGLTLNGSLHPGVLFLLATVAFNLWFIWRGLAKGIETFCKIAMPTMLVCALIVLARVLTLGTPDPSLPDQNVLGGLGFMWNPDLSKLGDFKTWLAAASQVFFSLSVGFGVIINYASYLSKKDDVVLSGLTASSTNEFVEVALGGLITIPAAFIFLGAGIAVGSSFGLGFHTLPVVFAHMGVFGQIIGAIFFLMLFLAGVTSSLSMLQPIFAFLSEALAMPRSTAIACLGLLSTFGSLWVLYFSQDLVALDTMDFWVGTLGIFVMATALIICFGWVFGIDRGLAEAHRGALLRIPHFFRFIIKYLSPAYLLVVIVGFCFQSLPDYLHGLSQNAVARWTVGFIAVVLLLLVVITRIGERRWRAAGLDIDGRLPMDDEGRNASPAVRSDDTFRP